MSDEDEVRVASPSLITMPRVPDDWDHDKVRPYGCKYCSGKFLSTMLLRKHLQAHEDALQSATTPVSQYECPICNRRFLYHESRASHLLLKHPGHFVPAVVQPGDNENKRKGPAADEKLPQKKAKTGKTEKTGRPERPKRPKRPIKPKRPERPKRQKKPKKTSQER